MTDSIIDQKHIEPTFHKDPVDLDYFMLVIEHPILIPGEPSKGVLVTKYSEPGANGRQETERLVFANLDEARAYCAAQGRVHFKETWL